MPAEDSLHCFLPPTHFWKSSHALPHCKKARGGNNGGSFTAATAQSAGREAALQGLLPGHTFAQTARGILMPFLKASTHGPAAEHRAVALPRQLTAPQLAALLLRLTSQPLSQLPSQLPKPGLHAAHWPLTQTVLLPQTLRTHVGACGL